MTSFLDSNRKSLIRIVEFFLGYSSLFKEYNGYNEYNQGFRLGIKIGSNHANLLFFEYQQWDYILLLIKQNQNNRVLKNKQLVIATIASAIILLASSAVYSNFGIIHAYAVATLSNDNVAKTIQVRITSPITQEERTYDSFSRVGFVEGEGNFLLESVPSKDKRPFYELVKKSIEDKRAESTDNRMHVAIDLYSGDGSLIQSLKYSSCKVDEYFIHGVDTRGKIFFLEDDGTIEIREVTKFSCVSFTIDLSPGKPISVIDKTLSQLDDKNFEYDIDEPNLNNTPEKSLEGDLFYNSMTNTLQKYLNGTWIDISGKGGPPTPRR